jgi:hypothetical protein
MGSLLEDSNGFLQDELRFRERFNKDGYLLLRNVLDKEKISKVRSDIIAILRNDGVIAEGSGDEPVWSGENVADFLEIHTKIHSLKSFDEMRTHLSLTGLMEKLYGCPVYVWMNVDVRTHTPKMSPITIIHQDYQVFYRGGRFSIAWIPLMDMDATVGGVDIAPGSHETVTKKDYVYTKDKYYTENAGALLPLTVEEKCGEFMHTTSNSGDVLMIHDKVAHRSRLNTSNKLRISMDVRFQPKESVIPWYTRITASDLERYNRKLNNAFISAGATQDQMQRTLWRLFWYEGGDPTVDRIKKEMVNMYPIPFGPDENAMIA